MRGELFLFEQDISKLSKSEKAKFLQQHLGIVFQSLFLVPTLTVLENISLPLLIAGDSQKVAKEKAFKILVQLHLTARASASPANLSKGQQQRVAIARAMVNNSLIIVCDEPTSALDQASGMEIMSLLHELSRQSSRAVLVVTHDHRIFSFADRIVYMNDGQIVSKE